jgi:hypothetical protein
MSNIFASGKATAIINLLKEKAFPDLPVDEQSKLHAFLYGMCDREMNVWGNKEQQK